MPTSYTRQNGKTKGAFLNSIAVDVPFEEITFSPQSRALVDQLEGLYKDFDPATAQNMSKEQLGRFVQFIDDFKKSYNVYGDFMNNNLENIPYIPSISEVPVIVKKRTGFFSTSKETALEKHITFSPNIGATNAPKERVDFAFSDNMDFMKKNAEPCTEPKHTFVRLRTMGEEVLPSFKKKLGIAL